MTRGAILLTSGLLTTFSAAILLACSGDPGPFFTPPQYPEDQALFNRGRLGLLTPALVKENELLAFRALSGLKIADPAASAPVPSSPEAGPQAWQAARRMVNPYPPYVNTYRMSHSAQPYVYYWNCLDDAFTTAAHTLNDRRQQYKTPAAFAAWVDAQDLVFQDCNIAPPLYPAAPAAGATPLERADREYQIAAAHFYAEDLSDAERRFRAIAADQKSPWQHIASYMVGRTLLREVSLADNVAAGAPARIQLQAIAKDSSSADLSASSQGLLQHLEAMEHPGIVIASLSKQLLLTHPSQDVFQNALAQSTYILKANSFNKALSMPDLPDAFDWVRTLEDGNSAHALDKWTANRSLPWLTLALVYAGGKDPAAVELIEQADRLKPDSPAFGTAEYNVVRLRIERGESELARTQVDGLLATAKGQPDSLVNGWRAERMRVAASFDDLLRWAPRTPIQSGYYSAGDENARAAVLDSDAASILNYDTPLSKLAAAAHSARLPSWSASDVALAAWTRAFMLNNSTITRDVAPVVAKAHPDWASNLTPGTGTGGAEWRFRAALLIAEHHEFQPIVPVDYRKHAWPWSWWCPASTPPTPRSAVVAWKLPALFSPPPSVISPEEVKAAESEVEKLRTMGSAQQFLAPIIMAWAQEHRSDPLVPEALHRLVIVVRYGCHIAGTPSDAQISKRAFDLLHRRYPSSEWTQKTPYWFDQ